MQGRFTPPAAAFEREGPAGVRLPVLRYQLLVGLLAIGALVSACELGLALLLGLPVLRGGTVPPGLWRWLAVEPFALLSWLALASLGLFVITAGLFLAWLQRARSNARALGMPARTPGALLWWFVPVVNLFRPFVVVRAVYRASRGGPGRAPGWLATWWLVGLANTLWLGVELALLRGGEVARWYVSDEVGVVLVLGLAAQGVLARPLTLAVVVAVQRAQREQRARVLPTAE